MSTLEIPSPAVLQNRGIPVLVHATRLLDDGIKRERVFNDDDEPVLEKAWIRFTMAAQAAIEERYGDDRLYVQVVDAEENTHFRLATEDEQEAGVQIDALDLWQQELERRPAKTLVETLGMMWDVDPKESAMRLVDTASDEYVTALGGALALAQGGSTDAVVRLLRTGVSSSTRLKDSIQQAVDAEVDKMEKAEKEAEEKARQNAANESSVSEPPNDDSTLTSPSALPVPELVSSSASGANSGVPSTSSGI